MQEVWGALLAYNLIRLEMAEVAKHEGVPPTDLSFTVALNYMRYEWLSSGDHQPGAAAQALAQAAPAAGRPIAAQTTTGATVPPCCEETTFALSGQEGSGC